MLRMQYLKNYLTYEVDIGILYSTVSICKSASWTRQMHSSLSLVKLLCMLTIMVVKEIKNQNKF